MTFSLVENAELASKLAGKQSLFIVDCRTKVAFDKCRIRDSLNFPPRNSLRNGQNLANSLSEIADELLDYEGNSEIVVVDEGEHGFGLGELICRQFFQRGYSMRLLRGKFANFSAKYPQLCVCPMKQRPKLLPLQLAKPIDASSCSSSSSCHSSPCSSCLSTPGEIHDIPRLTTSPKTVHFTKMEPTEILPNLYLGGGKDASNLTTLEERGIRHVLNVTNELPNFFAYDATFNYCNVAVDDCDSGDLLARFSETAKFIDSGRERKSAVLVHCLAGVSRSVTVVMAYLMKSQGISLEEAYDSVLKLRPNVAPNFYFMGQLLEYERQLTTKCT